MFLLLGYDIDKLSKSLIKTSNAMEYIESDIENIEATRMDDPIIHSCNRKHTYIVHLKEFLKLFKCLAFSGIHKISG